MAANSAAVHWQALCLGTRGNQSSAAATTVQAAMVSYSAVIQWFSDSIRQLIKDSMIVHEIVGREGLWNSLT